MSTPSSRIVRGSPGRQKRLYVGVPRHPKNFYCCTQSECAFLIIIDRELHVGQLVSFFTHALFPSDRGRSPVRIKDEEMCTTDQHILHFQQTTTEPPEKSLAVSSATTMHALSILSLICVVMSLSSAGIALPPTKCTPIEIREGACASCGDIACLRLRELGTSGHGDLAEA